MKYTFPLCFLLVSLLLGCNGADQGNPHGDTPAPLTKGIFSPIQLAADTTVVYLEDYFPNGEFPDMTGLQNLELVFQEDDKQLLLIREAKPIPALSLLELGFGNHKYHIPLKRSRQVLHQFRFNPDGAAYDRVQIAGSFNDWNPNQGDFVNEGGLWTLNKLLDPGLYQYQVVVDGQWMLDPENPTTVPNGMGGFNSQVEIGAGGEKMVWRLERADEGGIQVRVENKDVNVYAIWNNHSIPAFESSPGIYSIELDAEMPEAGRSYVQIYIGNNETGEVVDCLVPFEGKSLLTDPKQLTSADQHGNILYFMLVDRFHNGDQSNDRPVKDERVDPKANYHGGDLAGVQQKLEDGYFDALGVNTIWISPLNQNPEEAFQEYPEPRRWFSGYHGYWPVSSSKVDHRFGGNAALKSLVEAVHGKDKKIILDFVANHVHEQHPLIQAHPDWQTDLYLADSSMNIRLWDAQRLTTWFDTFLPSLDFSRPEVIEVQADSALFWLEEFQLDGFRHDATKHIPTVFWRRLTQKLKQNVDRPLFQIGETFGSRELIGDYVGSGMLDGQFDFNLFFDLRSVLTSDDPDANMLVQSVDASLGFYGHHHLMGNISGNHDMPRFIAFAGKDLSFSEDPKEAGWSRNVGVKDPIGYDKLEQLHAFLMMAPGVPVIYYGDEIGMSGADDPDNRRDMRFEPANENEAGVKASVAALSAFRSDHLATLYGATEVMAPEKEVFVLVRRYLGEVTALVLHLGKDERVEPLPVSLAGIDDLQVALGDGSLEGNQMALPAHSWTVLKGHK